MLAKRKEKKEKSIKQNLQIKSYSLSTSLSLSLSSSPLPSFLSHSHTHTLSDLHTFYFCLCSQGKLAGAYENLGQQECNVSERSFKGKCQQLSQRRKVHRHVLAKLVGREEEDAVRNGGESERRERRMKGETREIERGKRERGREKKRESKPEKSTKARKKMHTCICPPPTHTPPHTRIKTTYNG